MNKRLAVLEQMTAAGTADSFAWYALAMEYRKEQRFEDALATFEKLRARDADYLPMYLMAGQVLIERGNLELAKSWLTAGIDLARRKGDAKTLGELESALSQT